MIPSSATCRVFTFKEGLLSSLGHDLTLAFETFDMTLSPDDQVSASFDLKRLRVVGVTQEHEAAAPLKSGDHARIEAAMRSDVLDVGRFPSALAKGARAGETFKGTLTLHGVTKPIEMRAVLKDGTYRAELTLRPSDFGIKPYRAMLGALRVEDRVRVEVSWAAEGA